MKKNSGFEKSTAVTPSVAFYNFKIEFYFPQDLHAGPRTLLPHGASFHGYPITINVSSDLPRQEFTLQVCVGFFADTLLVLKIKYTVQNYFMRRINQCYAVYIFQCHSNESLKSIRHRVANRLNTNHEQIQLSTSEKLVCKNSLCCLT